MAEKRSEWGKIHRIKCGNGNCYIIENHNENDMLESAGKSAVLEIELYILVMVNRCLTGNGQNQILCSMIRLSIRN